MNIYQKLQKSRVELQNLKITKTGKNQSMTYFELSDFLPHINAICEKNGLITHFSIVSDHRIEKAILSVLDSSDGTKIIFTTPSADAELPRGQKIQNLGAKITYLRRYLLMIAFEIVESDLIDSINRDLTEEVDEKDLDTIKSATSNDELTTIWQTLGNKYKKSLILPHFTAKKAELAQEESNA